LSAICPFSACEKHVAAEEGLQVLAGGELLDLGEQRLQVGP
jgi:hypothetical protein